MNNNKGTFGGATIYVDELDYGVTIFNDYNEFFNVEIVKNKCTVKVKRWNKGFESRYDKGADLCEVTVRNDCYLTESFIFDMTVIEKAQEVLYANRRQCYIN